MTRHLLFAAAAAALSVAALSAPTTAAASCAERKTTGTVLGGIGGALLGNSISRGGGGAIVGGIGGAVVGHEVAGAGCGRYRQSGYYERAPAYGYRRGYASGPAYAAPARTVYYDARGNRLPDAAPAYGGSGYANADYRRGGCGTVNRAMYDARGNLTYQPVSTCR